MSIHSLPAGSPEDPASARARHWRRTRRLTAGLLAVWAGVAFVAPWFSRALDFPFFGWPFDFWVAAQGGMLVFAALIAVYARAMARLDRELSAARAREPH